MVGGLLVFMQRGLRTAAVPLLNFLLECEYKCHGNIRDVTFFFSLT